MEVNAFLKNLAKVFDGDLEIEQAAREELMTASSKGSTKCEQVELPLPIQDVMRHKDAHAICEDILNQPFSWSAPQTSSDSLYRQHSTFKSHVEILGPDGLVKSDVVRLGLYGMLPHSEYGIRTHPAEEIFIMLAGDCLWKKADQPYMSLTVNERSHHPSYTHHATKTEDNAFMSVYVWYGDLSADQYVYEGIPE